MAAVLLPALSRLLDDKIFLILLGSFIGLAVTELTRRARKRRLLMSTAMLPSFRIFREACLIKVQMIGDYGVVNESDLPLTIDFVTPFLVYNAGRGFQFKVARYSADPLQTFQKVPIAPNTETVLIAENACRLVIERWLLLFWPSFLWLEHLSRVRLGSKKEYVWRSVLYVANGKPLNGEVWYRPTSTEVSARTARLLALPGKLLWKWRAKKEKRRAPQSR